MAGELPSLPPEKIPDMFNPVQNFVNVYRSPINFLSDLSSNPNRIVSAT